MADIYPLARLCRFEGFPERIRVICGRAFAEARATPYSFGSRVTLQKTPQSGVLSGTLIAGEALPSQEIVYSDTGDDDTFNLKVAHYGYGRFYLPTADAACYTLAVIKGVRVEAAGLRRSFETVDLWDTQIAAAADLTQVSDAPDSVRLEDADAGSGASVVWFTGTVSEGGTIVTGCLQLGGSVSIQI